MVRRDHHRFTTFTPTFLTCVWLINILQPHNSLGNAQNTIINDCTDSVKLVQDNLNSNSNDIKNVIRFSTDANNLVQGLAFALPTDNNTCFAACVTTDTCIGYDISWSILDCPLANNESEQVDIKRIFKADCIPRFSLYEPTFFLLLLCVCILIMNFLFLSNIIRYNRTVVSVNVIC